MDGPTGFWAGRVIGTDAADAAETGHIGLIGRVVNGLEAISAAETTGMGAARTRHALQHEMGRLAAQGIGIRASRAGATPTHFEATLECGNGESAGLRITTETPRPTTMTWEAVVREPAAGAKTRAVGWRQNGEDGAEETRDALGESTEWTNGEAVLETLNELATASVRMTEPGTPTAVVLADPPSPSSTRRCSVELLGALAWIEAWNRRRPKRGAGGLQALVRGLRDNSENATIQLTYQPNGELLEAGILIQTRGTPAEELLVQGNRIISRPNWTTAWAGVRRSNRGKLDLETQGTGRVALAMLYEQKHALGERDRVQKVLSALATHPEVAKRAAIDKALTDSRDSGTWVPLINRLYAGSRRCTMTAAEQAQQTWEQIGPRVAAAVEDATKAARPAGGSGVANRVRAALGRLAAHGIGIEARRENKGRIRIDVEADRDEGAKPARLRIVGIPPRNARSGETTWSAEAQETPVLDKSQPPWHDATGEPTRLTAPPSYGDDWIERIGRAAIKLTGPRTRTAEAMAEPGHAGDTRRTATAIETALDVIRDWSRRSEEHLASLASKLRDNNTMLTVDFRPDGGPTGAGIKVETSEQTQLTGTAQPILVSGGGRKRSAEVRIDSNGEVRANQTGVRALAALQERESRFENEEQIREILERITSHPQLVTLENATFEGPSPWRWIGEYAGERQENGKTTASTAQIGW